MRYWPLSVIASSPMLHYSQRWELELMCAAREHPLTQATLYTCSRVVEQTPAGPPGLVLVHTVGAISRCAYLEPPSPADFARLERAGFICTNDTFGLVIDTLH